MVIREIHPITRIIDATQGIVDYVASDETLDCYREIVRADGWRFTHFQKNSPFVDSHDYSSITKLLGKVTDYRVEKNQLIERVQYSLEPGTLGLWAFKMVNGGFLKAVSVGFQPVRFATKFDPDFAAIVAAQNLDPKIAQQVRVIYQEQEQIELSQCVLGANPNALAKAYKAGALTEEDIDNFSTALAKVKTVNPTATPAEVESTRRRARLAILLKIQSQL